MTNRKLHNAAMAALRFANAALEQVNGARPSQRVYSCEIARTELQQALDDLKGE